MKQIVLLVLIFGCIAWCSHREDLTADQRQAYYLAEPVERATPSRGAAATFRCEGKTRCTQMSSCAEATFYVRSCPGTEMDGDKDGVPCESQHCGR